MSPGAPRGSRIGNYTNGDWTTEAIEERKWLTTEAIEERKWLRDLVQSFGKPGQHHG